MKRDIIYYGKCEHVGNFTIDDDRCFKRYYEINDFRDCKIKNLAICNDLIKLKVSVELVKGDESRHSLYRSEYIHEAIIEQVIDEVFYDFTPSNQYSTTFKDKFYFKFAICEEMRYYKWFSFSEAINILSNDTEKEFDFIHPFSNTFKRGLFRFIDNLLIYIKYKKYHNQAIKIKKEINHHTRIYDSDILMINDFLCDLMLKYSTKKI